MEFASSASRPKRLNVLTLDGGGVRGLSTLLILRDLMSHINVSLRGYQHRDVEPHEIFDLVAGTSTGGLIAVMLGKLGMSIDECITAYHELSKTIFGKKHIRGRLTHGLAPSRYSGSRLRKAVCKVLGDRGFDQDLQMTYVHGEDKIACAVVCREHENESRYSDIISEPTLICSLPCPNAVVCIVCEAARATSAAPTYFPVQKINGRSFVDGGIEFNNPSFAIFDHYTQFVRVAQSRRTSVATQAGLTVANHGDLNFTRVRIVNLGTGTKPSRPNGRNPGFVANLTPPALRMAAFLHRTLKQAAVSSENTAKQMEGLARVSRNSDSCDVRFVRFSANNGLCYIKLDKFKKLDMITTLTQDYLATQEVRQGLQKLAADIARDYLESHDTAHPASLTVPGQNPSHPLHSTSYQSPAATPQTLQSFPISAQQPSVSLPIGASTINDSTTATASSAERVDTPHDLTPVIPVRQSMDITGPAESMIGPAATSEVVSPVCS